MLATITQFDNLAKRIDEALQTHFVVHVANSHTVQSLFWFNLAVEIGVPAMMDEDKNSGEKTGSFWIDVKYDPGFPSHFVHANVRQPFHTDGSYESDAPNISFFYCIQEAEIGGATTFLDCEDVKACLMKENPQLLDRLCSTPMKFSKGSDSKTVCVFQDGVCNWNWFRSDKSELAQEFHSYLEERIFPMGLASAIKLKHGEALFFRDDKVFHGRNAFLGNRWLKKGGIKWTPR